MWPEVWCQWTPVPCLPTVNAGPRLQRLLTVLPDTRRRSGFRRLRRGGCEGREGSESFQAGGDLQDPHELSVLEETDKAPPGQEPNVA